MTRILVCPVRPGEVNDELRFALRSWEVNLDPGQDKHLVVVGHKPSWLEPDLLVSGNAKDSAALNVFDNIYRVSEALLDEASVTYMNDDFFCMDPTDSVLPVRRNITLAQHVRKFARVRGSWWSESLIETYQYLVDDVGIEDPLSFEVHRPLVAVPRDMLGALASWVADRDASRKAEYPAQWRSLYGNSVDITSYPVRDAKLSRTQTGVGSPWISTSDETWRIYSRAISARFDTPSRWEV